MKIYDTDNESYVVNRFGKIYMFASVDWPPDKDYEVVEALPDDAEERTAFHSDLMPPAWMEDDFPDNLSLYFEIEPDQARRLGEALIAHANNATAEEG